MTVLANCPSPGGASLRAMRGLRFVIMVLLCSMAFPAADTVIPLVMSGGTLACRGVIDGQRGLLLIDSGSSVTCLFPRQVARRRYHYRTVDLVSYTAAGPTPVTKVVKKAEFVVGGLTYPARNLVVLPGQGTQAIGLLGCDFLLATGAKIDLARRRMILTKAP